MDFSEELLFLKEQLRFDARIEKVEPFDNMVIAGMGGSGISGKIFQELYSSMPVYLVDGYKAPSFMTRKTLFLAVSYSGNTEEVLSAIERAENSDAHVVTISSGGELSKHGDQHIKLPRTDLNPRSALGYMLMPFLRSFFLTNDTEIEKAYRILADLDRDNGECMIHAQRINDGEMIPVIYGASPFKSIAYRWKTQFNENSKVLSYSNSFPELNHNDTMALEGTYRKGQFYFLVLDSPEERIKKRVSVTSEITHSKFNLIAPKGESTVEKLFYLIHYGDYISYNLAKLRKKDPSDVSLITELKQRISE